MNETHHRLFILFSATDYSCFLIPETINCNTYQLTNLTNNTYEHTVNWRYQQLIDSKK